MYTSRAEIESRGYDPMLKRELEDMEFMGWIADASHDLDSEVGEDYPMQETGFRFDAYPNTPPIIAMVATWLAQAYMLESLGEVTRESSGPSASERLYDRAMKKLADIRERKAPVYSRAGVRIDTALPAPVSVSRPKRRKHGPIYSRRRRHRS